MADSVGPSVFPARRGRLHGADRRPEAMSGGLLVPARHCGRGAPGTSLHPEPWPSLPVRMGASLCAHRWKPLPLTLRTLRLPGPHRLPPVLCCGSPLFGELSFCTDMLLRVSETLSKHVSALGAEEALGGHHTHPLWCSLSPQPFTSILSCHHLIWKLTMMTAARASSPSEGWGRDNRQRRNLRRRERTKPPQVHEQQAHIYRSICSPTE